MRRRLWSLSCSSLLLVLVGGCGQTGAADLVDVSMVRTMSATGQAELLLKPAGRVRGLVIFMHGIGADQDQLLADAQLFPVRDALLDAGYAVMTSYAHGDNAGNPASVQDQYDAWQDGLDRLPGVRSVDLLSFSMGGLDGLLVAASHALTGLHAVALLSPASDQLAFVDTPFGHTIRTAFGGASASSLTAAVRRNDPSYLSPSAYRGYTYEFWHSPTDTVVPIGQSARMVARLHSGGVAAQIRPLTGGHGDLSALDPQAVVSLFEAA